MMRTILAILALCILNNFVYAQQLEDESNHIQSIQGLSDHNGIYGALTIKATRFNDKSVALVGLRGAWVVNRTLGIGLDGHGLLPSGVYSINDNNNLINGRAIGGYGGILLEPIIFSNNIVHATFPVSSGGGWVGYVTDWEEDYDAAQDDYIDGDVFWYIEPGVAVELNVARFFRINFGVSRRIVQDFNVQDTPDNAFDTWAYTLALKFGRF